MNLAGSSWHIYISLSSVNPSTKSNTKWRYFESLEVPTLEFFNTLQFIDLGMI